jgi:hypothetical protein
MTDLSQQLTGALQSLSQHGTTTGQPISEFTEQERDSTGYFFLRLRNLYGSKYVQQFPDEQDLKLAKREWAKQIGQYTRDQIHDMFETVKRIQASGNTKLAEKFQWPDIGAILAVHAQGWEHRVHSARAQETDRMLTQQRLALTDQGKRERAVAARNIHAERLKSMFAGTGQ